MAFSENCYQESRRTRSNAVSWTNTRLSQCLWASAGHKPVCASRLTSFGGYHFGFRSPQSPPLGGVHIRAATSDARNASLRHFVPVPVRASQGIPDPRRRQRRCWNADMAFPRRQESGIVLCPPMSGGNSRRIVPYSRNACAIMRWRRSSRLNIRLSRSDQVA